MVSQGMVETINSYESIEAAANAISLFEAGSRVSVAILDDQGNMVWPDVGNAVIERFLVSGEDTAEIYGDGVVIQYSRRVAGDEGVYYEYDVTEAEGAEGDTEYSTENSAGDSVTDGAEGNTERSIENSAGDSVADGAEGNTERSIENSAGNSVTDAAEGSTECSIENSAGNSVTDAAEGSTECSTEDSMVYTAEVYQLNVVSEDETDETEKVTLENVTVTGNENNAENSVVIEVISSTALDDDTVDKTAGQNTFIWDDADIEVNTSVAVKHYELEVGGAPYMMIVSGGMQPVNQAMEILREIFPYILGISIVTAVLFALAASLYLTAPIVRLSRTSRKMAALDFEDRYRGKRSDEIGILGRNLNELSASLSSTLNELQSANEKLKSDIEMERETERKRIAFFSAVSHELKTPITILKGHLSGMLQGIGEYRNRDHYLQRSMETTEKMEGMVRELLTVSRIEGSKFTIQETDIAEQLRQQIADLTELMEEKELELEVDMPDRLNAMVNPPMLEKVFCNLLMNAIRYTPCGGGNQIRVTLRQETEQAAQKDRIVQKDQAVQEDRIVQKNQTMRKAQKIVCSIENTGADIPKEALPHLFEAFYRVEQSRNRQTGGSGLGLYIVKMILDQHGAEYFIENTEDGVRFCFFL